MAKRHFEAVVHHPEGAFVLVSSSLTGKIWDGCLWVFSDMNDFLSCPNLDMISTRTRTGNSDVLWLPNTKDLLVACDSGELELWSCRDPGNSLEYSKSLGCHDDMVMCLSKLSASECVVSGGADGKVAVWDLTVVKAVKFFKGHSDIVTSIAGHPTSPDSFITTSQDGSVRLWDLRLPRPARRFPARGDGTFTCVSWCEADCHSLALGTDKGGVVVFDMREDVIPFASFCPHSRTVHKLAFAPWNSHLIASISDDRTVSFKCINECGGPVIMETCHSDFVRGLSWGVEDHTLLTCGWDGQLVQHSMKDINIDWVSKQGIGSLSMEGEQGIGSLSMEGEQGISSLSMEGKQGIGSLSMEGEQGIGSLSMEGEQGISSLSIDSEQGISSLSVEDEQRVSSLLMEGKQGVLMEDSQDTKNTYDFKATPTKLLAVDMFANSNNHFVLENIEERGGD